MIQDYFSSLLLQSERNQPCVILAPVFSTELDNKNCLLRDQDTHFSIPQSRNPA